MNDAVDPRVTSADPLLDDLSAFVALAARSFAKAKRKAIEENDHLGITSPGTSNGVMVPRYPPKPDAR